MKLRRIASMVSFLCALIISPIVLSQNFIQVYTSFENGAVGTLVSEDNDGYTLAGYGDEYFIEKTDKAGKPLWLKEINTNIHIPLSFPNYYSPVIRTIDHGFILIDGDSTSNGRHFGLAIVKADSRGEVLWRKFIDESISFTSFNIFESRDSSVYVSIQCDSANAQLIKTDKEGNLLWRKDYNLYPLTVYGMLIQEFSDRNLLLAGFKNLLMIDRNGGILNEINLTTIRIRAFLISGSDEIFISTADSKLVKMGISGNILWAHDLSVPLYRIFETSDGGIAGLLPDLPDSHLMRFDINGVQIWSRDIPSYIQFAEQSSDGGFMMTGQCYYTNFLSYGRYGVSLPIMIKTDSEGEYKSVALSFPVRSVHVFWDYEIEWLSNNVSNIDIEFSADNGSTWKQQAMSVSTAEHSFIWTVPFEFSDKCLLRIHDSDNPDISDQSDSVFYIIPPYNPYDNISVNEVKMWIGNNGDGSHNPYTGGQGFYWPRGMDGPGAVFEDGLVWTGYLNNELRSGGSTYRSGLLPGNILPDGTPADSGDLNSQVWKISRDWQNLPPGILRDINEFNYNHWPVGTGIPWIDANGDGIYTAGIDQPKIYGDEMLFNVANDFDTSVSRFLYGSDPMGIEMQCVTFAKDTTTGLKDAVFKKYKLINKGNEVITDMYLSYWTDDDMGDATDDYIGTDTALCLGYTWNATNNDALYGTPPPAVGHMIIQGPRIAASPNDSARFGDGWIKGYVNLNLTAFGANFKNALLWPVDPPLGVYQGTVELNNLIRGLNNDGNSLLDPITNEPTKFGLSGDPVSGTGWYEGEGWPGLHPQPGDRRFYISAGPFTLAPGDTQEIAFAIFMALGSDNIQSIAALRQKALVLKDYYDNELVKDLKTTIPAPLTAYYLEQNYPNPFNSTTNIEYTIPKKSVVTIKIYDILGREVKTINQGEQVPWHYKVSFNASAIASGVYFYRIEAGSFIQTKKMILLK